jgi:acetyl esterase/lipase
MKRPLICFVGLMLMLPSLPRASVFSDDTPARQIPARSILVPSTVSPELKKQAAFPIEALRGVESINPSTPEEWQRVIDGANQSAGQEVERLKQMFPARIEPATVAGVKTATVTPDSLADANKDRLLVHVHGGGYIFLGGPACVTEAIILAHFCRMKVLSIDYRMPPEHPFPKAVDDVTAVWKEISASRQPRNLAMGGTSAGGGLTLAAVHRFKQMKLPLPGALWGGSPWTDLTFSGDTYETNRWIDAILPSHKGLLEGAAKLYAGNEDRRNPLISPVFGDFADFPPTILATGTRDLLLSDTARVHTKLRAARVESQLVCIEGMSHGEFLIVSAAPESRYVWQQVADFFDRQLGH